MVLVTKAAAEPLGFEQQDDVGDLSWCTVVHYVEETDQTKRSQSGCIRRRSSQLVRNAG